MNLLDDSSDTSADSGDLLGDVESSAGDESPESFAPVANNDVSDATISPVGITTSSNDAAYPNDATPPAEPALPVDDKAPVIDDFTARQYLDKWDTASPDEQQRMGVELNQRADYLDQQKVQAQATHFENLYTDPAYFQRLTQNPVMQLAARYAPVPEEASYRATNHAYLSNLLQRDPTELKYTYPYFRDGYARVYFDMQSISDREFFNKVADQFREVQTVRASNTQNSLPSSPTEASEDPLQAGRDYVEGLRQSHPNTPQYDDNQLAEIGSEVLQIQKLRSVPDKALSNPIADFLKRTWATMPQAAGNDIAGLMRFEKDNRFTVDMPDVLAFGIHAAFPTTQIIFQTPRERDALEKGAGFLEETAAGIPEFYGVDPRRDNTTASRIAEGVGGVLGSAPLVASGPAGWGAMVLRTLGGLKEHYYTQALTDGQSEEDAGRASTLKSVFQTAVSVPLYMAGGYGAKVLTDLLPAGWPIFLKLAARLGINEAANAVSSAAVRSLDAALHGKSVKEAVTDYDIPSAVQDFVFALSGTFSKSPHSPSSPSSSLPIEELPPEQRRYVSETPREPVDIFAKPDDKSQTQQSGNPQPNSLNEAKNPYRDKDANLIVPFRDTSHRNPELEPFEKKMREIANDSEKTDAIYNKLKDTYGGKVIGTDLYRGVLPEYAASREGKIQLTPATSRIAEVAAKDRLWREINNRGERKKLVFTAGGVAAGKSSVMTEEAIGKADLVYDGTLRSSPWAIDTIQHALARGWQVEVAYVQRPIGLAALGAIQRADKHGRWGSYANVPQTHLDAQKSILEIANNFKGNKNVQFSLRLNDSPNIGGKTKPLSLSDIDASGKYNYNISYDTDTKGNGKRSALPSDRSGAATDSGGERDSRSLLRQETRGDTGSVERSQEQLQHDAEGRSAETGKGISAKPFGWEIRGYTPEEHLRIFREAVKTDIADEQVLRLMAYGNPALEKIVGKVRPEDIDVQSFLKRNPQFDK